MTRPCRLVILVSGRGSNMRSLVQAIHDQALPAQVCAVISNQADAPALAWAHEQGLTTQVVSHRDYATRAAFDADLAQAVAQYQPDYVLLAGFMRVLTEAFVTPFVGRLINIHPALLPAFPGLDTHQRALQAGVAWHGSTVHFVTPVVDDGPIIAQWAVPVLADDTPDTLATRVLAGEHALFAQVLTWLVQGRVTLDAAGRVQVQGVASRSFLTQVEHA